MKSEPESYSWSTFLAENGTSWTGIRNFQARNNLRAMKKGDAVLFYHSVTQKAIVGLAKVSKEAYPDPTAEEGDWAAVGLSPWKSASKPLPLEFMKSDESLASLPLIKNSRLSVSPVSESQFQKILKLAFD